jgi:FAD/FMN-containing dehydrogenase
MNTELISQLKTLLKDDLLDASTLAERDCGIHPNNLKADWLARPNNTAQLQALVRLCYEHKIPMVPQGGRTGLSGGATSSVGQLIVSLERMNHILEINPLSRTAIVEAGVTLEALDQALAPHNLCLGLDLGARGSATLGGLVATNAGGNEAFRNGTMRERTLGLEVVLANGDCLSELKKVRKSNEGFNLERQFIGSEGCLGIITAVSVECCELPKFRHTALVGCANFRKALNCLSDIRSKTALIAAEVLCDGQARLALEDLTNGKTLAPRGEVLLLIEVSGASSEDAQLSLESALEPLLEQEIISDAWIAQNEQERALYWRIREDWAVDRRFPGGLWYDVSIPLEHIQNYIDGLKTQLKQIDSQLKLFIVGHLADGNLHLTVNTNEPIHERYEEISIIVSSGLKACGGSFSAEHGIGLEKKKTLARESSPIKLDFMRRLKSFWDPHHLLNPGKII